jgi:hypothetical protein
MEKQKIEKPQHCDHCGGNISSGSGDNGRADGGAFSCCVCGCSWNTDMILTHKGHSCPVHGKEAVRTAVRRIVQFLADQRDTRPTLTTS